MRGLFVTGAGTGVGKTIVSAALVAAIAAEGEPVRAYKPVLTGCAREEDEESAPSEGWPPDDVLLARAAGMLQAEVAPLRYGPPVSPHLAAELAGERIEPARLLAGAHALAGADAEGRAPALIVEGVGGLLVPLAARYTVRELALELGLPVVIAAGSGLGTINHTLLTLEAARAAGLEVRAVTLTPWPARPGALERSNRDTIARLGEIEVAVLPRLAGPAREALAAAGAELPWRRWIER